jgi:hypothetical protein
MWDLGGDKVRVKCVKGLVLSKMYLPVAEILLLNFPPKNLRGLGPSIYVLLLLSCVSIWNCSNQETSLRNGENQHPSPVLRLSCISCDTEGGLSWEAGNQKSVG